MINLKGAAKIQLFDADTGKETFNTGLEYNLITNMYKRWIEAQLTMWPSLFMTGRNIGSISSQRPLDLAQGVMLFDAAQTVDADNYIPGPCNCVGHAGQAYAGTNPYRGTLNQGVDGTGPLANGYRQVWDFASDKANGTINSVCLTTVNGGDQGYKNDVVSGSLSTLLSSISVTASKVIRLTSDYKTLYYQTGGGANTTLYLKRYITPDLGNIALTQSPQMIQDSTFAPSITVPANTLVSLEYVAGTLYGLVYNYSTNALTLKTYNDNLVEQSSPVTLDNSGNHVLTTSLNNWGIIGNTVYALSSASPKVLFMWNKTTGAYLGSYSLPSNNVNYVNTFDDSNLALNYSYSVSLFNGTTIQGPVNENISVYDYRRVPGTPLLLAHGSQSSEYFWLGLYGAAFFTINNLGSPVTKTNANTMKVTYDITW